MTTTSVSDPLVGRLLDGRYEILARVARGGMATVYRAHDRRLTRVVAVKVMHDGLGDDADFARKFDREARAAARLSNQHVVSVFDQGVDRDRPYIVMEFVEGCTLRHVLTREAPLEPLRALDLLEPVVHALASAHEAGLVHRDIKPENVLISDRGEIKVADFGLARAVTAQSATATQGLLIGTVSYLPPELVTAGRANSRSDIYSTGVVLFEMLTGQKPHKGDTPIQVAWSHVHNDVPAPSTIVHADGTWRRDSRRIIPPYLDELVQACTSRQPLSRPADARELLDLLRKARRALGQGIVDDPALTALMRGRGADGPAGARAVDARVTAPPKPVSYRPRSASSPATSTTGAIPRGATPASPVDLPKFTGWQPIGQRPDHTGGHEGSTGGAVDDSYLSPVPRPGVRSPEQTAARPHRPRSQSTPIFPNMSQDPVHRRRRGLVALVLVLVLALAAAGSGYWYMAHGRWTTAISLQTQTRDQARVNAEIAGFSFRSTEQYSEQVPAGQVISTDPAAGARVLKGSEVRAVVSRGPERYLMPSLADMSLAQASQAIESQNLKVGKVTKAYHATAPVDRVLKASQLPEASLKRDTLVDLVVSRGPQPIAITNQTGKQSAAATQELAARGFTVTSTQQTHDSIPRGQVISQSPHKGNGKAGDTINLVVSKGPVLVAVPKVTGADEATARQRLTNAGFSVKVIYNTEAWLRLNVVAVQDPGVEKLAPKGSAVTIYVS